MLHTQNIIELNLQSEITNISDDGKFKIFTRKIVIYGVFVESLICKHT